MKPLFFIVIALSVSGVALPAATPARQPCQYAFQSQTAAVRTTRSNTAARKQVKIYFYHEPGEYIDLSPVTRYVNAAAPARAAIEILLAGPNAQERSEGFDGLLTGGTFTIGSLKISRGTARVNFLVDKSWAGFPGDIAPVRLKSAVEMTLKQFAGVKRVRVTLNGEPDL